MLLDLLRVVEKTYFGGQYKKEGTMADVDRISELPNDLKEKILVRLPIKEAIRTSFLSSKWRYAWTYIPDLEFSAVTRSSNADSLERALELVKLVDIVLLLHQGPIQKFKLLKYRHHYLNDAVHRWMLILSRSEIRELALDLNFKWEMPSSFFSSSSLTDVHLENCVLKLPRSFNGLKLLKSLQLIYCFIGEKDLETLLSSCSYLESLLISSPLLDEEKRCLRISAPKLNHMHLVMSRITYIHLITPMLVDATLNLRFTIEHNSCQPILNDAFGSLCNIERLKISSDFMKVLANSSNMELPVKFTYLKKLVLSMDPSSQKENDFAVCIFQNAPGLETLEIFPGSADIKTFWEPTMPTILFANLKIVKILYWEEHIADFILVKLLLATSPVLVSLRLTGPGIGENVVYLKKLLSFKRASKEAQLFVDSIVLPELL